MAAKKKKAAQEALAICAKITEDLQDMIQAQSLLKVARLGLYPLKAREKRLKEEASELIEEYNSVRNQYNEEHETLRVKKISANDDLVRAQRSVDAGFKEKKPPRSLVKKWQEENIDGLDSEEARTQALQCESQLECLDDVDPKKIEIYRTIKQDIEHLEQELLDWEENLKEHKKAMEDISVRFVRKLQDMVDGISGHFGKLLEYLGFAGSVLLDRGKHQDDFTNYGFDVMVKFRDKLSLQRLDPFK